MTFCTNCGQKNELGVRFCTQCGALQTQASAVAPQPLPPAPTRSALPFVLILLGTLGLAAVIAIGGLVYAGYFIKEKATSVARAVTHATPDAAKPAAAQGEQPAPGDQDASAILGNLGGLLGGSEDDGDPVEAISDKDPVVPCVPAPFPDQAAALIPLKPDTIITTAWGLSTGDVESRNTITALAPLSLDFSTKTQAYKDDQDYDFGQLQPESNTTLSICNVDLAQSNTYTTGHWEHFPQIIHGVTWLRLSDKSFREVRSTGQTYHVYLNLWTVGAEAAAPAHYGGLLTRVEPQDVSYPMIVNDQRVNLPAIHLTGTFASFGKNPIPKKKRGSHIAGEIYVVDDPLDPLVLMYRMKDPAWRGGKFRIEVTKIDYRLPKPINLIEKQLAQNKRAVTWGIYFDFNKDTIKPESTPVLKEIVQALTDNPDWKLTVEGNTDNVGGDAYNLDLSKRRAAAVKEALVTTYHIGRDRLSTNGFGASRPVDTNETLEGRARNRRVELSRE
jgi:outer membrane protein OmpA-like peptidoglycan-associated protein